MRSRAGSSPQANLNRRFASWLRAFYHRIRGGSLPPHESTRIKRTSIPAQRHELTKYAEQARLHDPPGVPRRGDLRRRNGAADRVSRHAGGRGVRRVLRSFSVGIRIGSVVSIRSTPDIGSILSAKPASGLRRSLKARSTGRTSPDNWSTPSTSWARLNSSGTSPAIQPEVSSPPLVRVEPGPAVRIPTATDRRTARSGSSRTEAEVVRWIFVAVPQAGTLAPRHCGESSTGEKYRHPEARSGVARRSVRSSLVGSTPGLCLWLPKRRQVFRHAGRRGHSSTEGDKTISAESDRT